MCYTKNCERESQKGGCALSDAARARDALQWSQPIPLIDPHRENLQHHRQRFQNAGEADSGECITSDMSRFA